MGRAKDDMMVMEGKREVAVEIAIRVGLLERCDDHGYVIDPLANNHEEAYMYANSLITKSDPMVDIFNGNRRELTDLLKDICSDFGDECPGCQARNDD